MTSAPQNPSTSSTPRRFKPHQLSIAIGCGVGAFTLVSGVIPQFTNWHGDSEISRTVFGGIPGPLQAAFYSIIPMLIVWGSLRFADRIRNWERGTSDRRRTTAKNSKRA
jgi:hypothetical protein